MPRKRYPASPTQWSHSRADAGHVARQRNRPSFGICASCAHLRSGERRRSDPYRYQCELLNEPLAAEETKQICISFEPGKTSVMQPFSARKLTQ